MEKKENSFYSRMKKIDLSKRQTLAGQLMREWELRQLGLSTKIPPRTIKPKQKEEIEKEL